MRKKMALLLTWAIFSSMAGIIQSCWVCGPIDYKLVTISGQGQRIISVESEYYEIESYQPGAKGIRYDSIGLKINHDIETFSYNAKGQVFNQSFACSPSENYVMLADIIITSKQDYTPAYPAGNNLAPLVSIQQGSEPYLIFERESIEEFVMDGRLIFESAFITFNSPPEESRLHDLTIKYILKGGKEFSIEIQELKINP